MKPLGDCSLYTFVDSAYLRGRDPLDLTAALCQGGSDLIQLRAKDWPPHQVAETARRMAAVTRRHGVRLVINDHWQIAREAGAELCHLGQEDFFDPGRRHVGELHAPGLQIGLSTHAPDQARRAMAAEPAYLAAGPVFATPTKPSAAPVTLEYIRWAAAHIPIPWFAIGGISLENLPAVLASGAVRICVVSAILNAPDAADACRQFRSALDAARRGG